MWISLLPPLGGGRLPRLLLLLTGALFLGACGTPEVEAPDPELRAEEDPTVPELPPSILAAPIVLDLRPLVQTVEDVVPRSLGDLEERLSHPDRDRLTVAFRAVRGPLAAELRGDQALLSATLEYQVRAWYDPPLLPSLRVGCGTDAGEARPRARVQLASPLSLGGDWVLRSRVRVVRLEPASGAERDQCRITALGIDVTGNVLGAARSALEGNASRIDQAVAEVDLRSRLEGIWRTLQEPVRLTDDVWLVIGPEGVTRGRMDGVGTTLTVDVAVSARPRIVLGARPRIDALDLPPLEEGEVEPGAAVLLEALADYDAVGARLTRELEDRELRLGRNHFRIQEMRVRGIGGGRIALEVVFDGSARGRVFLVGSPELDHEAGEVHVPDLEFDVRTRNLLVGSLAWLGRGSVSDFLRERARVSVSDLMRLAGEQLERGINRDLSEEVTVGGDALRTELLAVMATREALVVHARARARAVIRIWEEDPAPPSPTAALDPAPREPSSATPRAP